MIESPSPGQKTYLLIQFLNPFAQLIESALNLPYLTPKPGTILLLAAGTVLLSAAVAAFSSVIAAYRLSRVDPGAALREGN